MPSLCLLSVHAHPDDEASKGAGTVARYHAEGVHTVLVTCTGGEEGDILNPAMDRDDVRRDLPAIRRRELDDSARIIGYDEVVMLGYRDSGMPGSPANSDSRSFAVAPLEEAVGRLVEVIRRTRPQVVVTYPRDQRGYLHPDHLRVNEISEAAFDAAGDPARHVDAGAPWQPARLLYTKWSVKRMRAMHDKFLELGMDSPFTDERMARLLRSEAEEAAGAGDGDGDGAGGERRLRRVVVDVSGHASVTRRALLAHATQVDPNSKHWFGLPADVADTIYPYDEYEVARDLTGWDWPDADMFAGLEAVAIH
ncbi:MAG: PIG-L family deacetylase [Acidimicrobiales bacterium]